MENQELTEQEVVTEEMSVEKEVKEREQLDLNKEFLFSYLVGIKPDGSFFWNMFGTDRSYANLMAVNNFANLKIKVLQDEKFGTGDKLIMEIASVLMQVSKKLDTLIEISKRPDNKL